MSVRTEPLEHAEGGVVFEGQVSRPAGVAGPRPGVLICHAFGGPSDVEVEAAERLAGQGWIGFVADLYGKGRRARSAEEAAALVAELDADRPLLLRRLERSQAVLAGLEGVDAERLAVIGFCFGGKAALDLARSGARLRAAVSFHGLLDPPGWAAGRADPIATPLLVLHGWDDPLAPPPSVLTLAAELTGRGPAALDLRGRGARLHASARGRARGGSRLPRALGPARLGGGGCIPRGAAAVRHAQSRSTRSAWRPPAATTASDSGP